jgi:hypothetical protein
VANVLRIADRERLEGAARRLEVDRRAMREAMREARAHGATLREIAEAAGVSHTNVAKQLRETSLPNS